jgi:hypothetical protein
MGTAPGTNDLHLSLALANDMYDAHSYTMGGQQIKPTGRATIRM